ncbi:IS607 family element RNA-guided endonuclease TnpB [Bifidobacterium aerophilum]|uniref:IS200/IS605 family element transposase accessory protein TnpB n=1 Tax=Bifidobacterium aerophilum TaxID=1798155 RepID=A0A6N9Z598_9BIFI|nr:IS607 family element RNA-guided endonuclease TnpB [Bifidobacterium aerophilum]NEG89671.1 IS200/IS605 family element transposase accessory protein TnpB [Bifidobacterium aerophilum]
MLEAVKVALDATPSQERLLLSHAGAARFAFNAGLAHVREMLEAKEKPAWSLYALRRWWNASKDTLAVDADGVPWWRENSKESYNSGLEALSDALSNWSKSRKGRRKGRKVGFPRFKSKDKAAPRFAYTTGSFGLIDGDPKALKLPRIGRVHCMENVAERVGNARVLRMTVSRHAGRWHASLTVERPDMTLGRMPTGGTVGIDLGVKTLATLSNGTVIPNPHTLASNERRLKRMQKALSRKTSGSNRRRKARERVARLHAHVAGQRRDLLHKLTTMLASTYSDICIEDLNVAGMVKNHHLAKAIEDASFAEFRRQLEYKTVRTGARLHVIDRWHPSSKLCSNCGSVKTKLSLNARTYHCESCGLTIDRDLNAAINIQVAGSAPETLNARGGDARPATRQDGRQTPMKREPSSHASDIRLGANARKSVLQAKTN